MYRFLLRNVVTGEKKWWDNCYFNGKLNYDKKQTILWQSPEDEVKTKYKILAWKWQGVDKYIPTKLKAIHNFAVKSLTDLDIPDEWRQDLQEYGKNPR